MIKTQFERFKNIQFSDSFQIWVSTLLFLPLAIYFRFTIGTSLVLDKDFTAYTQTAWFLGILFVLWLAWKWIFDDRLITTGLEKYLGLFFLIACLSTAFSFNPGLSLEKLIGISAYLLGIYLLIDLKRFPKLWQGIINALLLTAGLSSLLILITTFPWIKLYQITALQILTSPTYLLRALPRLPYSLGLHHSVTAGYLVMIFPLGVYQFIQSKNTIWKFFQITGLVLNLGVLILTQSRGGLLGFLCLFVVLGILYRKKIWTSLNQSKIWGFVLITALSLSGIGYIILLGRSRGFNLSGVNIQARFQLWSATFKIIQESPWLGSGLGTFGQKYIEFRDPTFYASTIIHAHNQLIQITAELGILGLITFCMVFWQGFRQLRKDPGGLPATSQVALIALGGLFGVLIPDAIFTSSMIVLLFIFYLVWLLPPKNELSLPKKTWMLSVLTLVGIILGFGAGWNIWKIKPYHQALIASGQNNWQQASTALLSALERDPGNPYYQHALGFSTGQVACQTGERYADAISYYQQALQTYDGWGIDHANLAVIYAASGDYQNAASQIKMAIDNYPQNAFFKCLLGEYLLLSGDTEQALSSYGTCIAENPNILDTTYWVDDISKKEILPAVIKQAEKTLLTMKDDQKLKDLAKLYLASGELEKADRYIQKYLEGYPDELDGSLIYIEVLLRLDDYQSAGEIVERLMLTHPRSPDLWSYQGKIDLQTNRLQVAEHAFNLSNQLGSQSSAAWLLGQLYQSQGKLDEAYKLYQKALADPYPSSDFSRDVAYRWPLKGIYVDCMPKGFSYTEFISPAINTAQNLETLDCVQAACIYYQLLQKVPTNEEVIIRFEQLPCSDALNLGQCFFNDP